MSDALAGWRGATRSARNRTWIPRTWDPRWGETKRTVRFLQGMEGQRSPELSTLDKRSRQEKKHAEPLYPGRAGIRMICVCVDTEEMWSVGDADRREGGGRRRSAAGPLWFQTPWRHVPKRRHRSSSWIGVVTGHHQHCLQTPLSPLHTVYVHPIPEVSPRSHRRRGRIKSFSGRKKKKKPERRGENIHPTSVHTANLYLPSAPPAASSRPFDDDAGAIPDLPGEDSGCEKQYDIEYRKAP